MIISELALPCTPGRAALGEVKGPHGEWEAGIRIAPAQRKRWVGNGGGGTSSGSLATTGNLESNWSLQEKSVWHFSTQPFLMEKERRSIYFGKLFPTHMHFMSRQRQQPAQQAGVDFWPGRELVIPVQVAHFVAARSRELLLMHKRQRHSSQRGTGEEIPCRLQSALSSR